MTTVLSPPKTPVEGRVLLHNISWQTYERILEDLADCSVPHLTYDRGKLEIMSPTAKHEFVNRIVEILNLVRGSYVKGEMSSIFRFITPPILTSFVAESLTLGRLEWIKKVREWAQQQKATR